MFTQTIRFILVAGSLTLGAGSLHAQDRIHLDDGTVIEAKVKEINQRSIVYRRWDNQDGADYVLTRREVDKIVYQNGTEERIINRAERPANPFTRRPDRDDQRGDRRAEPVRSMNKDYGRNIIAFAPIQMTNESPAGVGIQYERILDKAGVIALYLPVAIAFYDDEVGQAGTLPNLVASRTFTYLYPGAKFYPGGSGRRVSYSVGPSFALGFGDKYKLTRTIHPGTGSIISRYEEASIFKAGFMVNNGLNLQPLPQLYVGLESGIGILYYNNEENDYVVGDEPIVQFNFKMGYRF